MENHGSVLNEEDLASWLQELAIIKNKREEILVSPRIIVIAQSILSSLLLY